MQNLTGFISSLVVSGYLRPESDKVLREVLNALPQAQELSSESLGSMRDELDHTDLGKFTLSEDDLRGPFLKYAPELIATLLVEQARSQIEGRLGDEEEFVEQSRRVYSLYVCICDAFYFDRCSC